MADKKEYRLSIGIKAEECTRSDISQCIVSQLSRMTREFEEIGRTEIVVDSGGRRWMKEIPMDYRFSTVQTLRFTMKSIFHHTIEELELTFPTILRESPFVLQQNNSNSAVKIEVKEECKKEGLIKLKIEARKVDKKDFFGKSDPYFKFFKKTRDGWLEIYRSEIIKNTLFPEWKEFQLKEDLFYNNSFDLALKIEVWDWDRSTKDDYIGTAYLSFSQLTTPLLEFPIENEKKKGKKKYLNSGTLVIKHVSILKSASFTEYLLSGNKINFSFAVDFSSPGSQSVASTRKDKCESIILYIESVMNYYKAENRILFYGFGGNPEGSNESFVFIAKDLSDFVCGSGSTGISLYEEAESQITANENAEICGLVRNFARSCQENQRSGYNVLFIIVDRLIANIENLETVLEEVLPLPISLIFLDISSAPSNCFNLSVKMNHNRRTCNYLRLIEYSNIEELCINALDLIPGQIKSFMEQ